MVRQAMADRGIGSGSGDFHIRGKEVSRVEGFSDAAFAFAITLLVISLEVPNSFDELLNIMRGLPAFAVCFATLVWVWTTHYRFFRRFGLQDGWTIFLNSVLLFVIMFYVYPLKFMYTVFMGMLTGIQPAGTGRMATAQVDDLFVVYGIGFMAAFVLLGLLNVRAYRLREGLELDELERCVTRAEIARLFGVAAVGLLSIIVALMLTGGAAGIAGMVYGLIAAAEFFVGWRYGRQIAVLRMNQRGENIDEHG